MAAYMASLDRLAARSWHLMLPGHGAEVRDVAARLEDLRHHRRMREAAIQAQLALAPASAHDLARQIYTQTPAALLPAAERNILAHLIDLFERNAITAATPLHAETVFSLHPAKA